MLSKDMLQDWQGLVMLCLRLERCERKVRKIYQSGRKIAVVALKVKSRMSKIKNDALYITSVLKICQSESVFLAGKFLYYFYIKIACSLSIFLKT